MGWPTKNPMDSVPDIRFVKPVTPEPSYPTIRGPFHGIDLPKDTPAGAFVRNAVEANAANLEEKLRRHLSMKRAVGDNYDAEDFELQAGSRGMSASEVAARYSGTKHDADKPDAGTVLAGFWPLVRQRGIDKGELPGPVIVPMDVLDRLFDTTVSISKRLTDACALLPLSSLEHTLRPGTYGARKKYGPDCWLTVTDGVNRYYQAAGRHALKAINGEDKDSEGLVHGECVIWCIWAGATHVLRNEQERARE